MKTRQIIIRKGQMYPNKQNLEGTRQFIALLRRLASEDEQRLLTTTDPRRVQLMTEYIQNSYANANRLESLMS